MPNGVTFAHLIGNVGASSVGRDNRSKMTWMSIDADPGAFKPANPKSRVKGVNANERQDNWVFGWGGMLTLVAKMCYS